MATANKTASVKKATPSTSKVVARVLSAYTDIVTGDVHTEGETVELTSERFEAIQARGFVEKATGAKADTK